MAINAPTYFFHKLEDFRRLIVKVLEDGKKEIRFAAIAALRASLTIVAQRETNPNSAHSGSHEHNETIAKDYYKVKFCVMLVDMRYANLFHGLLHSFN